MKVFKIFNLILLIIFAQFITSCSSNSSMKPEDFKDKKPRLIIEEYLSGEVKAWGILQNRSGKVTRQFSAILVGKWDGKELILDETFNWDDGNTFISAPFNIDFLGTAYNGVYVSTNGYFTFGSGSSQYWSMSTVDAPNIPAIKVFAGDRRAYWIGNRTIGSAPNSNNALLQTVTLVSPWAMFLLS